MKSIKRSVLITSLVLSLGSSVSYASTSLAPASSYQFPNPGSPFTSFGILSVENVRTDKKIVANLTVRTSYIANELDISADGTADYGIAAVTDYGSAQFSFRVDGPGSDPVPIILHASATTVDDLGLTGRDSTVIARVSLVADYTHTVIADSCYGASVPPAILCAGLTDPNSFDDYIDGYIRPGQEGYVVDSWSIQNYDFVHLQIDPMVSIDPTWALTHPGYSLSFSPSVSATVPEPQAWAVMLLGLGGIGAALRTRRRHAPAARPGV